MQTRRQTIFYPGHPISAVPNSPFTVALEIVNRRACADGQGTFRQGASSIIPAFIAQLSEIIGDAMKGMITVGDPNTRCSPARRR